MPLKLPEPEKVPQDVLDSRYLDKHKTVLQELSDSIECLTRAHREEYETWLNDRYYASLEHFLKKRGENGTTRDVYGDPIDEKEPRKYHIYDVPGPRFLNEVTNYYKSIETILPQLVKNDYSWKKNEEVRDDRQHILANKKRPSFLVNFTENAKEFIAKEVKEDVDMIVRQFTHKTCMKMVGILRGNPKYKANLNSGSFKAGTFQGEIAINFPDGTGFIIWLYLKTNYRNHRPYLQWPLTFHGVKYNQGGDVKTELAMAQNVVEKVFNAVQREPDKSKIRPWTTVGVGYVVRLRNQKLALVLATRKDKAKLMYANGTEADATVEDIEASLYKISSRTDFSGNYFAYVESADPEKKIPRQDISLGDAKPILDIDRYSHGKRENKAREIVFQNLMKRDML